MYLYKVLLLWRDTKSYEEEEKKGETRDFNVAQIL